MTGCASCAKSYTEEWPRERIAIICAAEGEYKGRVTDIVPAHINPEELGRPRPRWCCSEAKEK